MRTRFFQKTAFILFCFLSFDLTMAQVPNWLWADNGIGLDNDIARGIATDGAGNVYVTGVFRSSSISFGPFTLNNFGTGGDVFLVKYDPDGQVIWAKQWGGAANDDASGIVCDRFNNLYLIGHFLSPLVLFGPISITNVDPSGNSSDIFLLKCDSAGNEMWAHRAGGGLSEKGEAIAVDDSLNVSITGSFGSDSVTFGNETLVKAGLRDVFIVKYDPGGFPVWARSAGGNDDDYGRSIAMDPFGNVHVTGCFLSPSITFGSTTFNSTGGWNYFVAKFDAAGALIWARSGGGTPGSAQSESITVDIAGTTWITGFFTCPSLSFPGNLILNSDSSGQTDDIFLIGYDFGGMVSFAEVFGGLMVMMWGFLSPPIRVGLICFLRENFPPGRFRLILPSC